MGLRNLPSIGFLLAQMRHNQWKSREEIESIQEAKLMRLISHAKEHVPYYRENLGHGDVRDLEDLHTFPLLSRKEVQAGPESFISRGRPLYRNRTSGSSGVPLTVYYSDYDNRHAAALRYHWLLENGVGPFDLQVNLTYFRKEPSLIQRLGLFRREYLTYSDCEMDNLRKLKALRPSVLLSYPSTLLPLAMVNLEKGVDYRVDKVFSSAEVLTDEASNFIRHSFHSSISNRYGAIETGTIAWQCEEGSMHVCSDSIIVEILDEGGMPVKEGEVGEVTLTPLWRTSMPFIRYRIGDRASLGGKCRCGRGLHVLENLQGRSNSILILPSGRHFMATHIGIALRAMPGILQFQTIQESRERISIKAVAQGEAASQEKRIRGKVESALPEPMDVDVSIVSRINGSPAGKICDFISRMGEVDAP